MGLGILTALVVVVLLACVAGSRVLVHQSDIPTGPISPLDEAERILAHRYARGQITSDEYDRMLTVLRR